MPEPGTIVEATVERAGRSDDLVVWATAAGVPCVSAARCPHQWSHLAHEGAVDGEGGKQNVNGRRDRKGDLEILPCEVHDGGVWVRPEG